MWIEPGAGEYEGVQFYLVQVVGPDGILIPAKGQIAKFTRTLPAGMNLVSLPVVPSMALAIDTFQGTYAWSSVRSYDPTDAADPWKLIDLSRGIFEFTTIDMRSGVWLESDNAGDVRLVGKVPCQASVTLQEGWNLVGFPSMNPQLVSEVTAGLVGPIRIEGPNGFNGPAGMKLFGPSDLMEPTKGYWMKSPITQNWDIVNNADPFCEGI
jgi:hypothetical protein